MAEPILTITDAAVERIKFLMAQSTEPIQGLRLGINTRGCNGMSYTVDYAKDLNSMDEEVIANGVKVYVDPMAIMYLVGTEMDYVEDKLAAHFTFNNPNAKSLCGCGESFNV
jgi:iron-sulfur cluster assembly protein